MSDDFVSVEEVPPPPPRITEEELRQAQEPRKRSTRRPAAGREKRPPERPRARAKKPSAPETPGPAETVKGLLQIPATAVVMVGQRAGSVPLVADGATVLVHGESFANAMEEWAKADPRVAAILDRLVTFGPASAVVMVLVIMGAQFTRNHNEEAADVLKGFGAVSAEEIITAAGLSIPEKMSPNGQVTSDGATAAN